MKKVRDRNWESDLTGYRPFAGEAKVRGIMISFKDVTQIEHIRRQIEVLQEDLNDALYVEFYLKPNNVTSRPASPELTAVLRDAMKKYTVTKIVLLLDEAARLGVDTAEQRQMLVEYLKPEEPAS